MVNFRQYAIFFHYLLNIFGFLKRNNFLRKTDQCERCQVNSEDNKFQPSMDFSGGQFVSSPLRHLLDN